MKLSFDNGPLVAGVLTSLDGDAPLAGDLVEVRLDKIGPAQNWVARCRAIEAGGTPVLLTIRLRSEGGDWPADNEERLKLYGEALLWVSAVDVELASAICPQVTKMAQEMGKACLVSHHDFEKTPPLAELKSIMQRARQNGAIPKIATMIRGPADLEILQTLLKEKGKGPACIIGMGEEWKQTRVSFPKLGSCLTYGYIDKPTAPGQWSVAELMRQLRAS